MLVITQKHSNSWNNGKNSMYNIIPFFLTAVCFLHIEKQLEETHQNVMEETVSDCGITGHFKFLLPILAYLCIF